MTVLVDLLAAIGPTLVVMLGWGLVLLVGKVRGR